MFKKKTTKMSVPQTQVPNLKKSRSPLQLAKSSIKLLGRRGITASSKKEIVMSSERKDDLSCRTASEQSQSACSVHLAPELFLLDVKPTLPCRCQKQMLRQTLPKTEEYNKLVEGFRDHEYPMMRGTLTSQIW